MARATNLRATDRASPAEFAKDYVGVALEYARAAVADTRRVHHCKRIQQAAARFLRMYADTKNPRWYFDPWHACDPCDFIEKLPHVEGKWASPEIELVPAQVFFVVQLFGFRKRATKQRLYTTALFCVARKNAKSTLAAAIGLYCIACEPDEGAQIITAATTGSQARIIFNIAKRMVERTPDLRDAFGIRAYANAVLRVDNGSVYKPINAKASTQDGLNPSVTLLDEIHAHKTHDLVDVLISAEGARASPLTIYPTTEGYINAGPWGEIRIFAFQVLDGAIEAEHFLVVYFTLDDEDKELKLKADDDLDESKWPKANPLWDYNEQLRTSLRKAAVDAAQLPSRMPEFRIKKINRMSATASSPIDLRKWQKCDRKAVLSDLRKVRGFAGLDLAETQDLCAWRIVWPVDDLLFTWGRRWVPELMIEKRKRRGMVPYPGWVEAGHLRVIEGDVIDYAIVEQEIREDCDDFIIAAAGYDPWNATDLVQRLLKDELPFFKFIQGFAAYHPAWQYFERCYLAQHLCHGGDPVLQWCANNLVLATDRNMNKMPDRKKSADKIDDFAALLMAIGIMLANVASDGDSDGAHSKPVIG